MSVLPGSVIHLSPKLGMLGHRRPSNALSLSSQVKLEEPVSVEMDNHMSDKDEACYDNAEAAFSDDEEDLSSRGGRSSEGLRVASPLRGPGGRSSLSEASLLPWPRVSLVSRVTGWDPRAQSPALGPEAGGREGGVAPALVCS